MKIHKKILMIGLVLVFVSGFFNKVEGIYLKENFNDELIQEAINLGEKYKNDSTGEDIISNEGYRFNSGVKVFNNSSRGAVLLDLKTNFYKIVDLSRSKTRKYQKPTEEEIETLINEDNFTIFGTIFVNDKATADPDNLHIIFKIKDEEGSEKIIQPVNIETNRHYYSDGNYLGNVLATFKYLDFLFDKQSEGLNTKVKAVFISSAGEEVFNIDFAKVR